mmetsp:Transcript_8744/g.18650  ORF Transcript_8744/g.18650 Transcript_8744/m.18650 type:complete len:152 (-) Transcript_8744:1561-2016(-)
MCRMHATHTSSQPAPHHVLTHWSHCFPCGGPSTQLQHMPLQPCACPIPGNTQAAHFRSFLPLANNNMHMLRILSHTNTQQGCLLHQFRGTQDILRTAAPRTFVPPLHPTTCTQAGGLLATGSCSSAALLALAFMWWWALHLLGPGGPRAEP